jgi:hypothetical protein
MTAWSLSIEAGKSIMESVIDERYRLLLIEHYLENNKEVSVSGGTGKLTFSCPFCGPLGHSEAKRKHRKAALLWNSIQHSWVFYCAKKGSVECMNGKTFSNLISALNPALGEAYRRERWHSGTTGKGHNCRAPQRLVGVTTSAYGSIKSRSAPDSSTSL